MQFLGKQLMVINKAQNKHIL